MSNNFEAAILDALRAETGKLVEAEIAAAKDRLEAALREATAKVVLTVFSDIRVERYGAELTIRVKTEGLGA